MQELRSSQVIDVELSEVAKEAFNSPMNGSPSNEKLQNESSIFSYGAANDDNDDANDHPHDQKNEESMSLSSDRFNEEHVIDILASVADGEEEHMVTREEDDWVRTVAGVAG